jgi:hypothetical protein
MHVARTMHNMAINRMKRKWGNGIRIPEQVVSGHRSGVGIAFCF